MRTDSVPAAGCSPSHSLRTPHVSSTPSERAAQQWRVRGKSQDQTRVRDRERQTALESGLEPQNRAQPRAKSWASYLTSLGVPGSSAEQEPICPFSTYLWGTNDMLGRPGVGGNEGGGQGTEFKVTLIPRHGPNPKSERLLNSR